MGRLSEPVLLWCAPRLELTLTKRLRADMMLLRGGATRGVFWNGNAAQIRSGLTARLEYLQIHSVKWQLKRARVGDVGAVQPDTVAQSAAWKIRLEVCVATEHLQIAFRILKSNPGTSGCVT